MSTNTPEATAGPDKGPDPDRPGGFSLDVEERSESIDGRQVPCCEMNFYYLDLTNTATVRVISSNRANYIVLWQAEDRDFAELQDVFAAMTVSLVQESEWLQSETDVRR